LWLKTPWRYIELKDSSIHIGKLPNTTFDFTMSTAQKPLANGNGSAVRPSRVVEEEEDEENIFVFIPNLIGARSLPLFAFFRRSPLTPMSRLLPHRACYRVSLLHAPPPSYLYPPV
jgi:hypothetical protein